MQQLKQFDFSSRPGRPQKYPWDKWTDGSIWEIIHGEDYEIPTENMQVNLHLRAARDDVKVQTRTVREKDREGLVFQFLDEPRSS